MVNPALIDDLLKQFAENPRRVFARLANEYRKRGELDSAIEICRSHVPLQPGYISGHIVLGQALYDSGSLDEARSAFETALALDPENLIALRHMGDIARANGDFGRARAWYHQLLEIDPQNEEVAAQIESLGAPEDEQDSSSGGAEGELGGRGEVNPGAIALTVDDDALATSPHAEVAGDAAGGDAAPAAEAEAIDAIALEEIFELPEPESATREEPLPEAPPVAAVEGLEATSFESDERLEVAPLELVNIDELAPGAGDAEERDEVAAEAPASQSAVAPLFPADTYDFDDAVPDDDAPPGAFATETMAELYLQQGFPDRALAIYRDLAARNPDDLSLRERVAELAEAEELAPAPAASAKSTRTAREFFGVLAYRRAPRASAPGESAGGTSEVSGEPEGAEPPATDSAEPPGAESSYAAASSEGGAEPHAEVAGDALAPAAPAATEVPSGRPGREAASALSLDDVFRDSQPVDGTGSRKGLSFDEFFARRGNGAVGNTNGSAEADAAESTASDAPTSNDEPQDLELFHAWLDGLKS